jgi:excisionase family DNA binding protein
MNSDHFDIDQAAKFLNVKISRLRTAILRKEIPYFKVGRLVRFHKHDLEKWIDDLRRQTQKKF